MSIPLSKFPFPSSRMLMILCLDPDTGPGELRFQVQRRESGMITGEVVRLSYQL